MRNLKKILALVLALVMSFSLMATANAFTDDEKIADTYKTAATVLDGLKVFQGYEDGSFRPQDPIRRSEVAAIIYRIVTGDVAGTQVGIYADYNKFTDVKSTSWYAGYVNFCANAEYIKGRDAKTFDPDAYVTGYEALAMILRAIGYDKNGEFTGTNWQVRTASIGEERGITKNISEGTLGTYASREVVAEILFQTILVDTVNYTPAFGYQLNDTSLGWDTFELEDIEGVVIANEYADLYDTEPLKAGKTELDVDGDSYTLAYSTELTDIGEARHAYITEGENVLYIADAGNTVFETGAETDISTTKKFEDATGLEKDDDITEYFINFDNGMQDSAEVAEYFQIDYTAVEGGTDKTVKYRVGTELDKEDLAVLKTSIETLIRMEDAANNSEQYTYAEKDKVELSEDTYYYAAGFRYGPNYNLKGVNYSSWKGFTNKYLTNTDDVATAKVTESDNGEWLKVIDNDGDGVADYVLLTEFAMSVIERISKDGTYTLTELSNTDKVAFADPEKEIKIDEDDIITEDELSAEDVVIVTKIDGNYYVDLAEMVTETVDKKGINSRTETMTCNGTDYVQSHIGYPYEKSSSPYYYDVTQAKTETTYDLYLDHFGFVRLFIESDYNTFMLLTDGWYENDRKTETFQAEYWNVDAAEKQVIDVADAGDVEDFIDTYTEGDQETWGRLYGADYTYFDKYLDGWYYGKFITNIAGYSEGSDGYTLKTVWGSTGREDYLVHDLKMVGLKLDDKTLSGDRLVYNKIDKDWDVKYGETIQATTQTQYYLVIKDWDKNLGVYVDDVITWTGYNNEPDDAKLVDAVGYAVTHASEAGADYYIADVVVFETKAYNDRDTFLVYDANNYWRVEYAWGIGYDADGNIADDRIDVDGRNSLLNASDIEFYEIDVDGNVLRHITENFAADDIYAGHVTTTYDVSGRNYIRVSDTMCDAKGDLYIYPETAPIYTIEEASDGSRKAAKVENWDDIEVDDHVILFTDGDDDKNVEYAIWVEGSLYAYDADNDGKKNDVISKLYNDTDTTGNGLWNDIYNDARYVAPTDLEAAIAAAYGVSQVAPMGQVPGTGVTAWDDAVAIYNTLAHLIATESMTEAERNTANTALTGLATKLVYTAKMDADQKIDAKYADLAPSYTENKADLDAAKAAADAKVDAWTIAEVIPTYEVPAIEVDGIDTDATELAAAKAAAEKAVKEAYEDAVALSKEYDPSLASAILNEYNLAQNAIAEAEADKDVDAMKAIDGAEITAIVANCQAVDTAAAVAKALPKQNVNFVTNESTTTNNIKTAIENELKKHDELMKDGSLIVTVAVSKISTAWNDLSVETPSKDEELTWTISIGDIKATGKIDVTVTAASAKKVADAVAAVKAADKAAAGEFFIANYETTNPGNAAVAAAKALGIDVNVAVSNTANPEKGVHTVELTLTKSSFTATVTVTGTCEKHAACNP